MGTVFQSHGKLSFTEFRFFTGHKAQMDRMFYNNGSANGFTKLVLPTQITQFAHYSFNQSPIDYLEVGANYSAFGNEMFRYRPGLGTLVIHALTPPTRQSTNSFNYVTAIYVPDEAVDTYKASSYWSGKASIIHPISEYDGTLYLS